VIEASSKFSLALSPSLYFAFILPSNIDMSTVLLSYVLGTLLLWPVNPTQTATDSSKEGQRGKKHSQQYEKQPAQAMPPLDANCAHGDKQQRGDVASDKEQVPITVADFPSVNVNRDLVDYATFTILILSTGLQLFILFGTLRATQQAANAATASADRIRLSERADIHPTGVVLDQGGTFGGEYAEVQVGFRNVGRTRAVNCSMRLVLIYPGSESSPPAIHPSVTLGSGSENTISSGRIREIIPMPILDRIFRTREDRLRIEATCNYDDVFGEHHTTAVTAVLNRDRMEFQVEEYHAD
jgi:hypothetical protein